ncbi:O-methyltransferase domain protein [Caprobacter fermentans]|uniref:O-methyltransferase domain protein n=2 Tax=Caproicibacter fermentans TaxID=2576756 RepID=A0A6N8I2P5_9FIRM|nr:O-methyltransferase domain protein [Caproicibacter fermentans]
MTRLMYQMANNPSRYYQVIHNYQEAQLLFAAIHLNVFSHLDTPATAEAIAESLNCDKKQIELLLLTLVSCGFVSKIGDFYANTPETKDFLSRNSEVFLGEALLFREKMTSLNELESKLKTSPKSRSNNYDFEDLAKASIPEMYTGRVQSFLEEMQKLFPNPKRPLRILDLGGGTGILAIEFVKHFPGSKATVFETPGVASVTNQIVRQHHEEKHVDVLSGNFNTDDLGGSYDLIIASGILNFVEGDIACFMQKLSSALRDGGYLLVIGQYADHKYDAPPNMLSWLSGFLNGVPLPPSDIEMERAVKKAGLKAADVLENTLFEGQLYRKGITDLSLCSGDVVRSFIELTEQIANSRTNVLDFGSENLTFYRGEIHMIKMIGDFPGIYSAELARKFGITRPVVHKTLQKLSERELIAKEDDQKDKKRYRLYLTEKGWTAYRFHQRYHEENDKALFDYLSNMPGDQLTAIKGFLDQAIQLIHNHA